MKKNEEIIQNALKVISLKYDELVSVIRDGDLKAIRILGEIRNIEEIFSKIGIPIESPKSIGDLISEEEKESIYLNRCKNYNGWVRDSDDELNRDPDWGYSIDTLMRQRDKFFSFIEFKIPKRDGK